MRQIIGLAAIIALAGCQSTSSPRPSPSPTVAEPMDLVSTTETLKPGVYTASDFEPQLHFELGDGWRAVQRFEDFFDVQRDVGSPDVIAVQFARPTRIWSASRLEAVDVTTSEAAADALVGNDRLEILGTSASQLGGLSGTVVEIENAGQGHEHVMELGAGELGIDPNRRLWVGFYDTVDGLLAVMVGGSVDRWQQAMAAAEPVLESIHVQGATE